MNFTVTANAAKRIAELIKQKDASMLALRIAVDGGGCSGFMYQYKLTDSIDKDDYIAEKNGSKVAIDQLSQQFLDGCAVDFIEELGSSYFQITNPKATAKCGCGNSFSV
jgi:iron-sulfur cluster insertion protein